MSLVNFIPKYIMFFDGIAEKIFFKFHFPVFDASIYNLNVNLVCRGIDQFRY